MVDDQIILNKRGELTVSITVCDASMSITSYLLTTTLLNPELMMIQTQLYWHPEWLFILASFKGSGSSSWLHSKGIQELKSFSPFKNALRLDGCRDKLIECNRRDSFI